MSKKLVGKRGLLLAEGCKLSKEKKEIENRIKEIKKGLRISEAGSYTNDAGDVLVVAASEQYTEIDGKEVLAYLKTQKMGKRVWECLKVQVTPLKKLVPDEVIDKLREVKGISLRYCFK
jgi:hypothetical protein